MITRRELLALFGTAAWSARTSLAQARLEFVALDHVEFYVSDVEKSRDFFVRIFGNTLLRNRTGKRYLKLGATYAAFETPRSANDAPAQLDHFSVSIRSIEMPKVHQFLEQQNIAYRDYPSGRDTGVLDPDGIRTQLSPENGWGILMPPNFVPEPIEMQDAAIFRPIGLHHVLVNVPDPAKSAAFYQKMFGMPVQRNNDRIWFQAGSSRIGLIKMRSGERPGINRFAVSVGPFKFNDALRALRQLGAKIEPTDILGAIEFRDPDGLRIQVRT